MESATPDDPRRARLRDLLRRALAGEDVTAEVRALDADDRALLRELLRELRKGLR